MADQLVINEVPSTNTAFFLLFRLYETMLAAGWTHVESSRGSGDTPSTTDRWAGSFGSLVSGAWIVLSSGAEQVVFARQTTSTVNGWIVWCTGYTPGSGTDVTPGTLPANAFFIRGGSAWSAAASWFGAASNTVATLNIGVRDATLGGFGSWWVIAQVPGQAYTSATTTATHRLGMEEVKRIGSGQDGVAFWCPYSSTSNWGVALNSVNTIVGTSTSSPWVSRWNQGQQGAFIIKYEAGTHIQVTSNTGGLNCPLSASGLDNIIYQTPSVPQVRRVFLARPNYPEDADGGYTSNILVCSATIPSLSTINSGAYAKFGAVVVWWNGNPATPPVEN